MSHCNPSTVEADEPAPRPRSAVTLIATPWIRLVSSDRVSAPDLAALPDVIDRAA